VSEKDGSVSEREDVSFNRLGQTILRGFLIDGVNVALVGKKLEAIRSPSPRRFCMVSALSRNCFREGSFVVLWDGGSVRVGVLARADGWGIGIGFCVLARYC